MPLPLSDRLFPFARVDPENQEDGEFNRILSDHCARVNSMVLEPASRQLALVQSVGKPMFPEGVPEEFYNVFPRAFPELVHSEEHEVEEYEVLGCCYCGCVGIPRSRCDNCRNPFITPMGRCVTCSVVRTGGTVCCGCDGILVGGLAPHPKR